MSKYVNPMDDFMPGKNVMLRFWVFGLILAAAGGIILWLNGAPDKFLPRDNSDYIQSAWGYIALWLGYLCSLAVCFGVFNSEGRRSTTGTIMGGIIVFLTTIFTVGYTILSAIH